MNALLNQTIYTPEDLLTMPDGEHYELVNGQLEERPMSIMSSWVGLKLARRLGDYCDVQGLGWVWGPDLGYQCFPHDAKRVRKPDVSFIRVGRLASDQWSEGLATLAPDLAAEVISPNDEAENVEQKVDDYLRAGVRLVWVLYPSTKTLHIFRPDGTARRLREQESLGGEDVVLGFECVVQDLFPPLSAANGGTL